MKLNMGCGSEKLTDYINIDMEESCKPDLVHDFLRQPLPYADKSADEVVLFHTIEHLQKRHHVKILKEIHRVLKPEGLFMISYPEWSICAKNWISNHKGRRKYWEDTIYGRQLYPSDSHVCIMDTTEFRLVLEECGFINIKSFPEPEPNEFSTIVICLKGDAFVNYEELVLSDMNQMIVIER